jgi:ABC-type taurine transport system substrate-binding protein
MISFEGLKKLMELRKLGKPLPKDWKKEVEEYFNWKIKAFDRLAENQSEWINQIEQAIKIAKYLGIDTEEWEGEVQVIKMKMVGEIG